MTEPVITRGMIEYEMETTYERDEVNRFYIRYAGKRYRVQLIADYDATPFDADCYSPEDIKAWGEDVWSYVGVIVTPVDVPESMQLELSDDLWSVEYEFPISHPEFTPDGTRVQATGPYYLAMIHPVPDMIGTVIRNVKEWEITQALSNYLDS